MSDSIPGCSRTVEDEDEEVNQSLSEDCSSVDYYRLSSFNDIFDSDGDSSDDGHTEKEKSSSVLWSDTPQMKVFDFTEFVGLLVPRPGNNRPMDYFNLLLDDVILQKIVAKTNEYAIEQLKKNNPRRKRKCYWKNLDVCELKTFLGLLLYMGIVKMPKLEYYWRHDTLFRTSFGDYMQRYRFLSVFQNLHFVKDEPKRRDRLNKIRPVVDYFNYRMACLYSPGRELSLDDCLIMYRGRPVPSRHTTDDIFRSGVKMYTLVEPDGMVLKLFLSASLNYSRPDKMEIVVLDLLSERLRKGHSVFADILYNSIYLTRTLSKERTHLTGPIDPIRERIPRSVLRKKLKRGETFAEYNDGIMVGKWQENGAAFYISNKYENEMGLVGVKGGHIKEKPLPFARYNENVGLADRYGRLTSHYPCERKTFHWYKKLFVHILQIVLLNSYLLFSKYSPFGAMSLLDYRNEVVRGLLTRLRRPNRPESPETGDVTAHLPTRLPLSVTGRTMRKRCIVCHKNGQRSDTTYQCKACDSRPTLCLQNCFQIYHNQEVPLDDMALSKRLRN